MNILKPIVIILAVLSAAPGLCEAANDTNGTPDAQARRARFREMFDRLQPLHIYGKVVDQGGNPVPDADVSISWENASFLVGKPDFGRTDTVRSDANGLWEFAANKPHRVFVKAHKDGFQYIYTADSARNLVEYKTTPRNPVVTVLRKKGETTFLIVTPSGNRLAQLVRVLSPHSETNALDLLAEKPDKPKYRTYADVQVAADFNKAENKWTITYSATNGTDGLIVGTNLLYEAPQDGYQRAVVVHGPPWPQYLYLRSRTPAIYSRLDLEYFPWRGSDTSQAISISYKAWINPCGSRNLEYESDLAGQWQLRKQLEQEAKADLLRNKYPPKPDLPKLIKEAKEKAEKDKGKP